MVSVPRDTRAKIVGKGTTEKLTMHMHTAVLKWQSTHWKINGCTC